jgi:hypothetical protein
MAQVIFAGASGNVADLNANFTELYGLYTLLTPASGSIEYRQDANYSFGFKPFGTLQYNFYVPASTDSAQMQVRRGTTVVMVFDASQNVGIGNSATAGYRLDVNGTVRSVGGEASAAGYGFRVLNNTSNGGGFLTANAGLSGGLTIGADGGPQFLQAGGSTRVEIQTSGHILPGADNTQNLGSGAKRYGTVYAGTGTINTSDAREKTPVQVMTQAEMGAARDLATEIGTFQFLGAVAKKGADARWHVGMTVQRAIDVMTAHGLDPMRYGFICYDAWPERTVLHPAVLEIRELPIVDEAGVPLTETVEVSPAWPETIPAGEAYGFRPDEMLLFIARGFEARLSALEAAA